MSKNELQVIESVNGTQLAAYADRDVVRELMERVMGFHPVIAKMKRHNPQAANETGLRVAQLAILLGASPLPGLNEIHVYDDGRAEVGINYWERRGEQKGGVMWDYESRPMTRQEQEMYGVEDGFFGAICRGVPMNRVRELQVMGMGINDIVRGQSMTGVGVVAKGERAKNGRPPIWTAIKRAKTDFYKSAFPYIPGETAVTPGVGMRRTDQGFEPDFSSRQWEQMGGRSYPIFDDVDDMTLDEFNDAAFDDQDQSTADDFNQDIDDGEFVEVVDIRSDRHLDIMERLQTAVHPNKTMAVTEKQLKLLHSGMSQIFDNDKDKKAVLSAIFPEIEAEDGSISTKSLTVGQASVIIDWLDATQKNQYKVSDAARTEAFIILNAVRQDEGQLSLFGEGST